ncbi:transmembrane protein KIAA1109 [Trichonephila clavipes]|nr:transmembrane protein KIAA1109 [Trichonephila clavipes]
MGLNSGSTEDCRLERLMHFKSLEAQSPHNGMVRQIDEYSIGVVNHSPQPPWETPQNRLPDHGHELIRPIIIQFSIILDSLTIGAAVLPSLRAQYQMGQVTSMGVTGSKAKFTVDLPQHTLSFNTKIQPSEGNMPSSASVDLPLVHISAEYIQDPTSTNTTTNKLESFTDGVVLCQGSYLSALAEIGSFEHSLTTDLLNHLVLVQKVFMKEVNEVVQKMSGADKPVPLWGEQDKSTHMRPRRLLFSLLLRLKGIQITATTPTSSAVRLETGAVELQLSNRVQNMSSSCPYTGSYMKLFGKAQVDVNLALGQLIKNALFEEAEPEFQQFAYFKTRICMRNALQVLTATQQVFERVPQISQLSSQALGTLFLQLTVDDMGICLPLNPYAGNVSSKMYDTELKAAVVVTLESTRISACSCGSLVSKAKFTG